MLIYNTYLKIRKPIKIRNFIHKYIFMLKCLLTEMFSKDQTLKTFFLFVTSQCHTIIRGYRYDP